MADNVLLNEGTGGQTCATDDCAGVQYQKVKLVDGTADATTVIPGGAKGLYVQQPTAADLNVTAVIASGTVTTVMSITDALPAGSNAIGKLAANDGVDIGNVDVASIAAGTNLIGKVSIDQVTANANEVVIKSGTVTAVTGITNALPAGTNAIGKLAANDGVDIGNVDVASIAAGTNLIGKVSIDQVTANANEVVVKSGTVTAVTNITNAVAVTNADITTVAGAVSGGHMQCDVLQSFALETGGNLATIAGAVAATHMQCDIVGALPAGTAAIGKLAANSGVDIGDVDVTSISAGSNLIGDVAIGGRATGGSSIASRLSTADDNDWVAVTDGAATLYGIVCTSTDAHVMYLKLYNKATAPDPSADTPVMRIAIPGLATGAGVAWSIPQGIDFPTGLGYALVAGAADTDETHGGANEVMINIIYKH